MDHAVDQDTRTFFEVFERSNAAGDAEATAGLFATSFLMAGANGVQVVRASDLRFAIPKRKHMLESAGCSTARLLSLQEAKLDNRYSQVRTEWQWRIRREGAAPVEITLPSTFIVEKSSEGLRIVFYLSGDLMATMRERGLLPPLAS
jgi:hypothetical protein